VSSSTRIITYHIVEIALDQIYIKVRRLDNIVIIPSSC
jgi:hypothetical protein